MLTEERITEFKSVFDSCNDCDSLCSCDNMGAWVSCPAKLKELHEKGFTDADIEEFYDRYMEGEI